MDTPISERPVVPRPGWFSFICWLIIFSSGYNLASVGALHNPQLEPIWGRGNLPEGFMTAHLILGSIVHIVAAAALMKGKRWGRALLLAAMMVAVLVNVVNLKGLVGITLPWGLVYTGGAAWLLTRPSVNEFLTGIRGDDYERRLALAQIRSSQRTTSDGRLVAGFLSLGMASFFILLWVMVFGVSADRTVVAGLVMIAGFPAAGFLWGGVVLIGSARWAELCGAVLALSGSIGALYGLMFWYLARTPYWDEIVRSLEQTSTEFVDVGPSGLHAALLGLCIGLVGFSLIHHQWTLDRETLHLTANHPQ